MITVDGYLHFFIQKEISYKYVKPDITLKIQERFLDVKEAKEANNRVEVIKKSDRKGSMMSYFWEQKPEAVYKVKFQKADSKEEFIDYIRKMSA